MKFFSATILILALAFAGCSTPSEPTDVAAVTETTAPSLVTYHPATTVTPYGTCGQLFILGYGTYNGNNAFYQSMYQVYCVIPDGPTTPPTVTPPTTPPPSNPPYVPGRSGGTRTAPNYSRYAIHY